jgi:uncharacterized protein YjbJ (UPF0337 family)
MKGNIDKAKGHAKQAVGDLIGNKKLQTEGKIDVAKGNVKNAAEGVAKTVDKTAKKIKNKL